MNKSRPQHQLAIPKSLQPYHETQQLKVVLSSKFLGNNMVMQQFPKVFNLLIIQKLIQLLQICRAKAQQ